VAHIKIIVGLSCGRKCHKMHLFPVTIAVCGFHVYKDVWEPTIGEVLLCEKGERE